MRSLLTGSPQTGIARGALALALALAAAPAAACEYPDEGNMPLRRAVSGVRALPEVEAWANFKHRNGAVVHYAVRLDRPRRHAGRCWWPVEVAAEGSVWHRFYVTPDGRALLSEDAMKAGGQGRN